MAKEDLPRGNPGELDGNRKGLQRRSRLMGKKKFSSLFL
jgi:hypothetical protein